MYNIAEYPAFHQKAIKPHIPIFLKPGRWYTHVFAKKSDSEQKSYTGLFNICANVKGALENTSFPYSS